MASAPHSAPIDPADWSSLGGLLFVAKRLVEGLYAGPHTSVHRGRGLEFHDYRAYAPGDDLRDIDWRLFGRTDRYYLRRYQQLSDMQVHLLMDCSASMAFNGVDARGRRLPVSAAPTKLSFAATLAAAVAFLAVRQADRVSLTTFADGVLGHEPPAGTWGHLKKLCAQLEGAEARRGQGDVGIALHQTHGMLRGGERASARPTGKAGGLLVVISDLLDEPAPWIDALARFRHDRFEVLLLQVLSPQELDLSRIDPAGKSVLQMIDSEAASRTSPASMDSRAVRDRYGELIRSHIASIRRSAAALHMDHHLVTTDQPAIDALRSYLVRRRGTV